MGKNNVSFLNKNHFLINIRLFLKYLCEFKMIIKKSRQPNKGVSFLPCD